jgi:aspartate carbamoyltransferase regulatory subunit
MKTECEKTLKVQKIKDGTVIDHIDAGLAWAVVNILSLDDYHETIMVLSNLNSKTLGKKDIIKVESKNLSKKELDLVSLLSPHASVNFISDFEVSEKYEIKVPKEVVGALKCTNPACVTNSQPVTTKFSVEGDEPLSLRCKYCERLQSGIVFK